MAVEAVVWMDNLKVVQLAGELDLQMVDLSVA